MESATSNALRRPGNVKGLVPSLPERGRVKIGIKGAERTSQQGNKFQPPQKLDHFLITTLERGPDGNFKRDDEMHKRFGDKPTELPIRLIYNERDLNFQSTYVSFIGKTRWCSGNGEIASRQKPNSTEYAQVECPCFRLDREYEGKDRCKISGRLNFVIDGAPGVGGVWTLRTTSWNTVSGILASLDFLRSATGGRLAGIPLRMALRAKSATTPKGQSATVYVVSIEYPGDMAELQQRTLELVRGDKEFYARMEVIEAEVKKIATMPTIIEVEDADEFFPTEDAAETTAAETQAPAPEPEAAPAPRTRKKKAESETATTPVDAAPTPEPEAAPAPAPAPAQKSAPMIDELFRD